MSAATKLKLAYDKLSPNNLEAGLPGREKQNDQLYHFLYERLKIRVASEVKKAKIASGQLANIKGSHLNKTIFVCGVPGTGKTATVLRVIENLTKDSNKKVSEINKFQCVYINGQKLGKPDKIYTEILQQITGENMGSERAQERLDSILKPDDSGTKLRAVRTRSGRTKIKKPIESTPSHKLVVIDELDLLYSDRRQDVFYSLFDWPTTSDSRMILIAIANAMDLPERFMRGRLASRLGWDKLVFESYTSSNLESILEARLGSQLMNDCFEKAAIVIATKQIGRTTGDARRILDTCRLAIDKTLEKKLSQVSADIIHQVGFKTLDAQRRNYIAKCPPLHLLVLKSILHETDKVGEENVDSLSVFNHLHYLMDKNTYLKQFELGPAAFASVLVRLAASGLIYVETSKPLFERSLFIKNSSIVLKDIIKTQQPRTD